MVARRFERAILAFLIGLLSTAASADPPLLLRDYRFITDKSTVEVTGGFAGVDWPLNILGAFGLATGYNYVSSGPTDHAALEPFAEFTEVKAILFDPRRASPMPSPGWDLDETLNLSGLKGTFTVPDDLYFLGADGQGQAIRLEAAITGRLVHLTGGTSDPRCCDMFRYKVDAWAHQLPWADFNADDRVDAADLTIWRQNFGTSVAPGTSGDANGDGVVDAGDYTVWRDQMGESDGITVAGQAAVPEPGTLVLTFIAILSFAFAALRRWQR
jgi:hypothetical protein